MELQLGYFILYDNIINQVIKLLLPQGSDYGCFYGAKFSRVWLDFTVRFLEIYISSLSGDL